MTCSFEVKVEVLLGIIQIPTAAFSHADVSAAQSSRSATHLRREADGGQESLHLHCVFCFLRAAACQSVADPCRLSRAMEAQ